MSIVKPITAHRSVASCAHIHCRMETPLFNKAQAFAESCKLVYADSGFFPTRTIVDDVVKIHAFAEAPATATGIAGLKPSAVVIEATVRNLKVFAGTVLSWR